MYRCDRCGEVSSPRTPSLREVVVTRAKSYPHRNKVNRIRIEGKVRLWDDPGGEGREIVREITVCPDCGGAD